MSQPLVSIIIPTHNRRDMVIRLLKSVVLSTYTFIEIIVVDDASTDSTSAAIKKAFPKNKKVHIVRNTTNKYAAGSRNVGTRVAKGKYLFYIDDDNVLDKYAISALVRTFEDDETIGELGLVNFYFHNKKNVYWLCTVRDMRTTKTYQPKNLREYSDTRIWDTVDAPNAFIIRAEVIKKYGISFCEKFGIMYEESDVAYRIRNAGYSIKVVRDAVIYHDVGDYMYHFLRDSRLPYVFARNRIIFHSMYSTKIQLISICMIWIWVFMFFYWYKALGYNGRGNFSIAQKIQWMLEYLKGNVAGLSFVTRNEKLVYPKVA